MLKWFAKNIESNHPKMVPIPIGIENRWYKNGRHPEHYLSAMQDSLNISATQPLLVSFKVKAAYRSRMEALAAIRRNGLGSRPTKVATHDLFLRHIQSHQFVLSPPGNGLTCHRTWETIYMGRIPILIHSTQDPVYEDLPVVLVQNWNEVTTAFLDHTWQALRNGRYNFDKRWQLWWWLHILKICLETP